MKNKSSDDKEYLAYKLGYPSFEDLEKQAKKSNKDADDFLLMLIAKKVSELGIDLD